MSQCRSVFATLIRTHHVTSHKKLLYLKRASAQFEIPYVVVRYGGSPGLMYGESPDERALNSWIRAVQDLKFKDYQCVYKPELKLVNDAPGPGGSYHKTNSVSEFGKIMERAGLGDWFKHGLLSKRPGQFDTGSES